MRNWNAVSMTRRPRRWRFWSYLWGIETTIAGKVEEAGTTFWSYLWGIETSATCPARMVRWTVLIVPMRNWNQKTRGRGTRGIGVLIVPMRNWNYSHSCMSSVLYISFWSYLWGIETYWFNFYLIGSFCFDRTYEELKLKRGRVSIQPVPARFWSYLWGIETPSVEPYVDF